MNTRIVAPLALLASITLLTSCTEKTPVTPTPVTPTQSATPAPADTMSPAPASPADTMSGTSMTPAPVTATATATVATPVTLTRTETVAYTNPSGRDEVEFSVTVQDGVITAASATPKATNEISTKLQTQFSAAVSDKVVGMKIADFDVDAIGGASLTTGAFEMFVRSF